jgi:hypothetical protein
MDIEMHQNDPVMLTCWKDIARYMGKGVRTVQRWEQEFGLPVRRPNGTQHKTAVIANTRDLDEWVASNWSLRVKNGDYEAERPRMAENIATAHALREAHKNLVHELSTSLHALVQSCSRLSRTDQS